METNQNISEKDCITLSEFPLATTLLSFGFKLIGFDRNPKTPHKLEFIFERSRDVESAIENYWTGNLVVEPKSFWNFGRELKGRMRSEFNHETY